jgi:hypothetical protein
MTSKILVSMISGTLMLAGQAFAQPYSFISIDVSCPATADPSACPDGLAPGQIAAQTGARGINARGDIVGFYAAVAGGRPRGFVLTGGRFTSLDFPVAGVRATLANGINAWGEIVGQYTAPVHDLSNPPSEDSPLYCPAATDPACIKAFLYSRGTFSTLQFPDTVDENGQERKHLGAIAQRITADGDVYGCVHGHDLSASMFGAAWTRAGTSSLAYNGGALSEPMAVPMSMSNGATLGGTVVVGLFMDMANRSHGYVVRDGVLEPYDATPAVSTTTPALTSIWDMNASQQFVGTYRVAGEPLTRRHGFLQNPDGSAPLTVDFTCQEPLGCAGGAPLGTVAFHTIAYGISPSGVIVGQYQLVSGGATHGFVATPPDVQ